MKYQRGSALILIVTVILIILLILAILAAIEEGRDWQRFKVEHNCKVTARINGDVFNTLSVGANGQPVIGIGSTPSKTAWLCDDGITYYR